MSTVINDYIPRFHDLCSDAECQKIGHRVPLGEDAVEESGDCDTYVKNTLQVEGKLFHTRLTQGGGEGVVWDSDLLYRIQDVHSAILRALSYREKRVLQPTEVTIALIDDQTTQVTGLGSEIKGEEIPLLEDDGAFFESTETKTVHAAMRFLQESFYIVAPSLKQPDAEIQSIDSSSTAFYSACGEYPEGEEPFSVHSVPPLPSEERVDPLLEEGSIEDDRVSMSSSTMEEPSHSTGGVFEIMEREMNRESFDSTKPADWPERITFADFRKGKYPDINAAFKKWILDPQCSDNDVDTLRQLFYKWFGAACRAFAQQETSDECLESFCKEHPRLPSDREWRRRIFRQYYSFAEWRWRLPWRHSRKEGLDLQPVQSALLSTCTGFDLWNQNDYY